MRLLHIVKCITADRAHIHPIHANLFGVRSRFRNYINGNAFTFSDQGFSTGNQGTRPVTRRINRGGYCVGNRCIFCKNNFQVVILRNVVKGIRIHDATRLPVHDHIKNMAFRVRKNVKGDTFSFQ